MAPTEFVQGIYTINFEDGIQGVVPQIDENKKWIPPQICIKG